jgi:transcriptional regulator with XRE-family HTH domain
MKALNWFKKEYEEAKDKFEFRLEGLELEITEKILELMDKRKFSKSVLAKKLNVSKSAITNLLNNGSNMTLKRLLTIADALNCVFEVKLVMAEEFSNFSIGTWKFQGNEPEYFIIEKSKPSFTETWRGPISYPNVHNTQPNPYRSYLN